MGQVNSHRERRLSERHPRPARPSGGAQLAAENGRVPGLSKRDHEAQRVSPVGVLAEEEELSSNPLRAPGDRQMVADASSVRRRPSQSRRPRVMRGGREAVGEALPGEHAGGALSREKFPFGAPTLWRKAEGNTGWRAWASTTSALRGLETSGTRGSHLHGNREIHRLAARPRPPAWSASARRNAPIR